MKKISSITLLLLFTACGFLYAQNKLKSPEEHLGYALGQHFSYHHQVASYFEHAAAVLPNAELIRYGQTYERRPLMLLVLSSEANMRNLEQIRTDNLKRAGLLPGTPVGPRIPIVWLSYNVHGNESVGTESVMMSFYEMATKRADWLEKVVVIFDPAVNPDGRDRYANWYNQKANKILQPDINSIEHREPWPGGRANHYLFDLNRDWAWQTQVESQNRMKVYHEWMPQIHVDFHEQAINNPYYFAPAAEPLHELITDWQREFQVTIGRNHARYFDEQGWFYFTKESFDLLYPSYGDSYPIYNGAIGMTYEKGGSGSAGLGVLTNEGDTLTLYDRILHHHTTGISTIEMAVQHSERLVTEFEKFFDRSMKEPWGKFKTYIIPGDQEPERLAAITELLDKMGIQYGHPSGSRSIRGYAYLSRKQDTFTIGEKDIVISAYQPKSVLVNVLFDPDVKLSDSLTYDITAWALPYVYGLRARATQERINVAKPFEKPSFNPATVSSKPYAYLLPWKSIEDIKFLAALHKEKITVRQSTEAFTLAGKSYGPGTLVITRRNNENLGAKFDERVQALAKQFGRTLTPASTGFVDKGKDFGSSSVRYLKAPKVLLVGGPGTSSLSFGENWYFFEQVLDYPLTVIDADQLGGINLSDYDVLIMPSGGYGSVLTEATLGKIRTWISAGGKLIAIEGALNSFVDKEGFAIKRYADDAEKKAAEDQAKAERKDNRLAKYGDRRRAGLANENTGSIWQVHVDPTHPLGFGYDERYFVLRNSSARYPWMEGAWNVGVIKSESDWVSGFIGDKAKARMKESMAFGVQNVGRGSIVYLADNPLFRGFWWNGYLLYGNAVFSVGN
jgi:hypothetical protein